MYAVTSLFRSVFFNLFAAAETYISVKIIHGTPWHITMIGESSGVGKVEFSGCLGPMSPAESRGRKPVGV